MAQDDRLVQRWRKPVTALAVKDTVSWATADLGRATLDYQARFSPEQIERFRLGYVCLECWEPHEAAFPERCSLCGYEMRARQGDDFTRKFKGIERDPRAALIAKELDALDDRHERNFHVSKGGVLVPRSLGKGVG